MQKAQNSILTLCPNTNGYLSQFAYHTIYETRWPDRSGLLILAPDVKLVSTSLITIWSRHDISKRAYSGHHDRDYPCLYQAWNTYA